jgi:two-component system, OmpR family, KDP operon response regulator KdpE
MKAQTPLPRILIVDDEPAMRRMLRIGLGPDSYAVSESDRGMGALEAVRRRDTDLILLDLGLPDVDGLEIIKRIRYAQSDVPIIVLSNRGDEVAKVAALDLGADDYVTKPFSIQELLARVRAHLRRAPERTTAALETGDFVIDVRAHTITVQAKPIHLTPKEFELLLHLARNAGKVMTHRALLTAVWGAQSAHQPEYLRVFVGQLRKKLEGETGRQYIQTEPWVGYRFVPEGWTGNED